MNSPVSTVNTPDEALRASPASPGSTGHEPQRATPQLSSSPPEGAAGATVAIDGAGHPSPKSTSSSDLEPEAPGTDVDAALTSLAERTTNQLAIAEMRVIAREMKTADIPVTLVGVLTRYLKGFIRRQEDAPATIVKILDRLLDQ